MQNGIVITTDLNGVRYIKKVTDDNWESTFINACKTDPNFKYHHQDDIDDFKEDGVYVFLGQIVAMIWLDENGEYDAYN